MDTDPAWSGLLDDGEEIIWQGQPDTAIQWRDMLGPVSLFGLVFTGISVVWIAFAASLIGPAGFPLSLFPLFGLPFLAIGVFMMVGHLAVDAYRRRHTFYTLTDRSAFIATSAFGRRKLASYPIAAMPFLELEDGLPGSVMFGEERSVRARIPAAPTTAGTGPMSGRRGPRHTIATSRRVGFRRIAEARQVYRLIRDARGALNFAQRQDSDAT